MTPNQGACCSLKINGKLLEWLPFPAYLVIAVLFFFPWVKLSPGGVNQITQNGLQASFNGAWEDEDAKELKEQKDIKDMMKVNVLSMLYIPVVLICLFAALFAPVLALVATKLPPPVQKFVAWRSALVLLPGLLGLAILCLQLLIGFSLESAAVKQTDKDLEEVTEGLKKLKDKNGDEKEIAKAEKMINNAQTMTKDSLRRTGWLDLIFYLQIVGVVAAGASIWLAQRNQQSPIRIVAYS